MKNNIQEQPDTQRLEDASLAPLNVIRTETVLSQFPIHNLAKHGKIDILIVKKDDTGAIALKWEVSYNDRYGQARQLGYKIDTLVINRRIEEEGRPLPKMIRIGSLREIAKQLELGGDTNKVRRALRQNAFAAISAKFKYRTNDGTERYLEADFTRYSVIFTGEKLPNGRTADAVYIILNEPYRGVVNNSPVRPLDWEYMKVLPPAAQRFYEIVSRKIFAALKNHHEQAKLCYSEYCTYSAQRRYFEQQRMQNQMNAIHREHKKFGYIAVVKYVPTVDEDGKPDWNILYTPGSKAHAEFRIFNEASRPRHQRIINEAANSADESTRMMTIEPQPPELSGSDTALLAELTRRGISEKKALALLRSLEPGQEVQDQLEYIDHLVVHAPRGKFHNPPGLYITAIQENSPVPDDFITSRKQRLWKEARESQDTGRARQAQLEIKYDEYQAAEIQRYVSEVMPQEEYQRMFAKLRQDNGRIFKQIPAAQLDELTARSVADELKQSGRVPLLSFEEFCLQQRSDYSTK